MHTAADTDDEPDFCPCMGCAGFNLRKAMRAVSQVYDDALRPAGIRGTQFSLLVAIRMAAPVTVTQLADKAVMDRTTLTRNLDVLVKQGLIALDAGDDRRTRMVTITGQGRAVLIQAHPLWEQAQSRLRKSMPEDRLEALLEGLRQLTEAAQSG